MTILKVRPKRQGPTGRPALSIAFGSPWPRIALAFIGLVLIAQAAWAVSQQWNYDDGFSIALAARSSQALSDQVASATSASARSSSCIEMGFAAPAQRTPDKTK